MTCQIYPAMSLGGTPGRFPVSEVFELPFLTGAQEASSRPLRDFVQTHALSEFAGTRPIATWVNGSNVLHLRDKPVRSLSELKGLKHCARLRAWAPSCWPHWGPRRWACPYHKWPRAWPGA